MKLKFSKYLILSLLLISFSFSYAYDYTVNDSAYTISNSSKIKVDLFIKKKIDSIITANKYITALNKINPISLKDANKKNIYYYLKYKLYIYVDENMSVVPVVTKTVVQKPINTPITLLWITIPNINKLDTTNKLSADKKAKIDKIRNVVKEYVEIDNNMEFIEHGSYYRVKFSQYYDIKWDVPVSLYLELWWLKNEILIRQWDIFKLSSWGYTIEKKYSIKDIVDMVKFSSTWTWGINFNIKNNDYYIYIFSNSRYYKIPDEWLYISDLNDWNNIKDFILIKNNKEYRLFYKWFTETKLFNTSLLANNNNPSLVLTNVWLDDYLYKTNDIENIMTKIRDKTLEITKNTKNDNEKITAIYTWITWNIDYDVYTTRYLKWEFTEATYMMSVSKAVFSWMETYRNKSWVCDWYSKLMLYMLSFAWVNNSSIEIGNANIGKWKLVPHAWIKIGNLYYDPTWDYTTKWVNSKFKRFWLTGAEIHKTHIPSQ